LGGPVEIEVRLNTKKAEGQIDKLSESLKKGQKQAENIARTERIHKAIGVGSPSRSPGVGTSGPGAQSGKSITETLLDRAKVTALRGNAVASQLGQKAAGFGRMIPEGVVGAAKFAGAAAIGYAAVSTAAQAAPTLTFVAAKVSNLESQLSGLQLALEQFRRVFSTFESGIGALKPTYDQSKEYMKAAMRLGADVPNMGEIANQNFMAEVMQKEVDKKFEQFKTKEVYAGGGEQFRKFTERSLSSMKKAFGLSFSR
jgi:hypothetical protein